MNGSEIVQANPRGKVMFQCKRGKLALPTFKFKYLGTGNEKSTLEYRSITSPRCK
jgi:hypothetical protein